MTDFCRYYLEDSSILTKKVYMKVIPQINDTWSGQLELCLPKGHWVIIGLNKDCRTAREAYLQAECMYKTFIEILRQGEIESTDDIIRIMKRNGLYD